MTTAAPALTDAELDDLVTEADRHLSDIPSAPRIEVLFDNARGETETYVEAAPEWIALYVEAARRDGLHNVRTSRPLDTSTDDQ